MVQLTGSDYKIVKMHIRGQQNWTFGPEQMFVSTNSTIKPCQASFLLIQTHSVDAMRRCSVFLQQLSEHGPIA